MERKLLELAKSRKTVRRFRAEAPPREDLLYAIEVAKEAPSGMNAQPWHFLVVDEPKLKEEIRAACEAAERVFYGRVSGKWRQWLSERNFSPEKPFLSGAPYLILVFAKATAPFWLQSSWLAVGYLLLALEERGLGTVTYTPPDPKAIAKLVGAPTDYKLQTILPVGYPDDPKPKYPRKGLREVTSFNRFTLGSQGSRQGG